MASEPPPHAMNICTRKATLDDAPAIAPLFDAYRVFYKQPSNPTGTEQFIHTNLAGGHSVIFIAFQNEEQKPIGFTQLYPALSSISMRSYWILNDLYVIPDARRQGVAVKLLAAAKEHALETEGKGLELSTAVDNVQAQRLYEASGYVRDTDFYHYFLSLEE